MRVWEGEGSRFLAKMASGSRNWVLEDDDGRLSELWSLKRHNSNRLSDFRLA